MYELEKTVTLKGTNEGYFLILDDEASLSEIYEELEDLFEQIKKDNKLEQSFDLTINTGNRILSEEAKTDLTQKITEQTNFVVKQFSEYVMDKELANQWHKATSPQMMIKNIRNGQIVHSERDIILFGDVRPGAVVRSAGSVIVIGNVQGTVHAGSKGNEEAIIVAPFLFDAQVRIGEHIEVIETNEDEESADQTEAKIARHQVVFLNDLHVIEFGEVENLARIRPDFAKDLGGFEEWQKQL